MQTRSRVVVGVSGSLRNRAAVRAAAAAAADGGRTLVVVISWWPPGGWQVARRLPCPALDNAVDRAARDAARSLLFDSLACLPHNIEVQARVVRGLPGQVLVDAAGCDDLLVVGAGRRGVMRLGHGAVTRHCVAHAACPVLVVPEPDLVRDLGRFHRQRRVTVPDDLAHPTT